MPTTRKRKKLAVTATIDLCGKWLLKNKIHCIWVKIYIAGFLKPSCLQLLKTAMSCSLNVVKKLNSLKWAISGTLSFQCLTHCSRTRKIQLPGQNCEAFMGNAAGHERHPTGNVSRTKIFLSTTSINWQLNFWARQILNKKIHTKVVL